MSVRGKGVVATILGVSVTIGFGVSQLADGVYSVTGMGWLVQTGGDVPRPSTVSLLLALAMIIGTLPFTMVMTLMCVALGKALYRDNLRDRFTSARQPAD